MSTHVRSRWLPLVACATLVASFSAHAVAQPSPTPDNDATMQALVDDLERLPELRRDISRLEAAAADAEGETSRIFRTRVEQRSLEVVDLTHEAARTLLDLEDEGAAVGGVRDRVVDAFERLPEEIHESLGLALEAWRAVAAARSDLTPAEESELLDARRRIVDRLDDLYRALLEHVELGERLGTDVAGERARLVGSLGSIAEMSSVFLELSRERLDSLETRLAMMPDDAELPQRIGIAHARIRGAAEHLRTLVELMDRLDMDTAAYQQQVIRATGDVDAAVLDVNLAEQVAADAYASARAWLDENGARVLFKAVLIVFILAASWLVGRLAGRLVRRALESGRFDVSQLLQRVVVSSVRRLVLLLGALIALAQLGISIGPLLAGLGVAGFIVGFALQDTLSNFASGLFILLYRPYDVGDAVEAAGVLGKVSSMSLVNTTILTFDNQRMVVPNNKIWGGIIKNITAEDVRRVDLVFGISYADDIPKAEAVLEEILRDHDKVLDDPEPVVRLHELGDSSVNFVARPWTRTEDYWDVYWDVTREVKLRFDREGISIPFPQRDVHLFTDGADAAPTVSSPQIDSGHVELERAMPGEDETP